MKRFTRIALVAAFAVSSLVSGVAMADPGHHGAPNAQHQHARHEHGGMLEEALRDVQLRPNQRQQIENIKAALGPSRDAVKAAKKDFATLVAGQVAAGAIDINALTPKSNVLVLAETNEKNAERAAINALHGVLDKAQREQLANAIEGRMARAHQNHGQHPRGQNGQGANPQHAHGAHGPMAKLAKELNLTDAQKQQIGQILRDQHTANAQGHSPQQAKEQHKKMLEAFKQDQFSMDAVVPNNAMQRSREHIQAFVGTVQKIMPVLTAQQRSVAADKLREHAAHGKMFF